MSDTNEFASPEDALRAYRGKLVTAKDFYFNQGTPGAGKFRRVSYFVECIDAALTSAPIMQGLLLEQLRQQVELQPGFELGAEVKPE